MSTSRNGIRRPASGLVRLFLCSVLVWLLWLHAGAAHAAAGVSSELEVLRCEPSAGVETPRSCEAALESSILTTESSARNGSSAEPGGVAAADRIEPDIDEPAVAEPEVDAALNVRAGAPMCDVMAASTVAVLEIPEVDRARLEQLPCDSQRLLSLLRGETPSDGKALVSGGRPKPPTPSSVAPTRERGDAAAVPSAGLAARAEPATLAHDVVIALGCRSGHRSRVERPPAQQR
jgi:hypothetical protein